ncbi:hypothetical protein Tco_1527325, partial [Tanacetum coccineum]
HDKYVQDMLKKFDMESVRTAITPYEASKPKSKDESDDAVNVHLYRSMIGSLMYLTASRPDIMFAVSACSRHQVTPLTSKLNAVKKIFKYLKGQPKLGLWYPRDSPFVLAAYSDSDYAGSHGDRKSTTGGCPKVHKASEMVESNSDYAEELARLQRQEHEAKDTAEKYGFGFSKDTKELLRQVDMVPAGSLDPAASSSAGSIDPAASISVGPAEPFSTVIELVHADETSLLLIIFGLRDGDIYHHPRTGIPSSSYDADFGGTVTNLAPIVAVDHVPTKRVNTIHPQS